MYRGEIIYDVKSSVHILFWKLHHRGERGFQEKTSQNISETSQKPANDGAVQKNARKIEEQRVKV